jgi:hypothetical protein
VPETSDLMLRGVFPDKRRPQPSTGSQHYNLKFGIHGIKAESLQQADEPQVRRARKMGPPAFAGAPVQHSTASRRQSFVSLDTWPGNS